MWKGLGNAYISAESFWILQNASIWKVPWFKGRGKFTKITISLNSTQTKISYERMQNFRENYHGLKFAIIVF